MTTKEIKNSKGWKVGCILLESAVKYMMSQEEFNSLVNSLVRQDDIHMYSVLGYLQNRLLVEEQIAKACYECFGKNYQIIYDKLQNIDQAIHTIYHARTMLKNMGLYPDDIKTFLDQWDHITATAAAEKKTNTVKNAYEQLYENFQNVILYNIFVRAIIQATDLTILDDFLIDESYFTDNFKNINAARNGIIKIMPTCYRDNDLETHMEMFLTVFPEMQYKHLYPTKDKIRQFNRAIAKNNMEIFTDYSILEDAQAILKNSTA